MGRDLRGRVARAERAERGLDRLRCGEAFRVGLAAHIGALDADPEAAFWAAVCGFWGCDRAEADRRLTRWQDGWSPEIKADLEHARASGRLAEVDGRPPAGAGA